MSLPMEMMTGTGAMGRPDRASADKGQRLLEAISAKIVDFVREFSSWPRPRIE